MKQFLIVFLSVFTGAGCLFSQTWITPMRNQEASFYAIQKDFYSSFPSQLKPSPGYVTGAKKKDLDGKMHAPGHEEWHAPAGYHVFRRWEDFMAPRVYPSGNLTLPSGTVDRFLEYLNENPEARAQHEASLRGDVPEGSGWTQIGPVADTNGRVAGRVNVITFHPLNPAIWYAGACAGGLWKSTNSGDTWTTNTDLLPSIGISDLAFHPINPDTMYIATGDGEIGDTYSRGIMKSTDGGATWALTGLDWPYTWGRVISKILIHPSAPGIMLTATSNGVFRTSDGGDSWTQITTEWVKDIEFKPGDPNTVYATGFQFYRSTDNGLSFTVIGSAAGLPVYGTVNRMAIAVTPDDPSYVYVVCSDWNTSGYYGTWRSTDSGLSWTMRSTTPNILGWDPAGTSGQAWYNLTAQVSPTDKEELFAGGTPIYRSRDGGTTWTNVTTGSHVDFHDIEFLPGSSVNMAAANDGGIYVSQDTGTTWKFHSTGMCISEIYRTGTSSTSPSILLTGHQDNGTNRNNGTVWVDVLGGDGMDCFIDRTNDLNMFGSYQIGGLMRSFDGGYSWSGATSGLSGSAAWVTPWTQDPVNINVLYTGYNEVFRSTDYGGSWTQITSLAPGSSFHDIKVAPSNTQWIYACTPWTLYRSTDGGSTWNNITSGLPTSGVSIGRIAVDDDDYQHVWISFYGWTAGEKVYVTTNGGSSWTNMSAGLPNLSAGCIRHVPYSTNNELYAGTDMGVYYRNDSHTSWQPFLTGLPNVPVADLDVFLGGMKIRAATYGRGLWEAYLVTPIPLKPVAAFSADVTYICAGDTVQFSDVSKNFPWAWNWTFSGGSPASSTLEDPVVVYNTPGIYAVTLTVSNAVGSNTSTHTAYIRVIGQTAPPLSEGFEGPVFPPDNWMVQDAANDGQFWRRMTTNGSASPSCTYFENYWWDTGGKFDALLDVPADLSAFTSPLLTFDVAYGRYPGYADTLEVWVSTDCGDSFTRVYRKGGDSLATAPPTTAWFSPDSTMWRTDSVMLTAWAGQSWVQLAFVNRGHYGNTLYLDNINLTASPMVSLDDNASSEIQIYPNPGEGTFHLIFRSLPEVGYAEVWDASGRKIKMVELPGGTGKTMLDLTQESSGIYLLRVMSGGKTWTRQIAVQR